MGRRLAPLALLAGVLACPAGAARAAARVVGGTQTQVQSAPWTVSIRQSTGAGSELCTGAIVDPLHVLTAAHCVYDPNGALAPITALTIRAGISNYVTPLPGDDEQDRAVSSFRVHPGYTWSTGAGPDDVALLALSAPLDLNGVTVAAAPLPVAGAPAFPAATAVTLAGFGRERPGSGSDGSLNAFTGTIDAQGACGGHSNAVVPDADAIAFCASSPAASVCSGDSGSALVTADAAHTIVGVASAGAPGCAAGSRGVFTNVAAPEILDFIRGNDRPATAPRASPTTYVDLYGDAPLRVGSVLSCRTGNWEGSPALSYAFVDTRTGEVLQHGAKSSLTLPARDAGDTVACRVTASNAGGTAVLTTASTAAIGPAARLELERVPAVSATRGHGVKVQVSLDAAPGTTGKYGVCVAPPARVGGRACASRRIAAGGGRVALTVTLHIRKTAPAGRARLAVTAVAGPSHGKTTALLRVRAARA